MEDNIKVSDEQFIAVASWRDHKQEAATTTGTYATCVLWASALPSNQIADIRISHIIASARI